MRTNKEYSTTVEVFVDSIDDDLCSGQIIYCSVKSITEMDGVEQRLDIEAPSTVATSIS